MPKPSYNPKGYPAQSSQYLQQALDYNHQPTAPDNWRVGIDGTLHQLSGPDDNVMDAPLVSLHDPTEHPFWKEVLHALPYAGAAMAMGIPGALAGGVGAAGGGGAAATTAGLGPTTAGSMAATSAAMSAGAPAGIAAAGGGGSMGLAGTLGSIFKPKMGAGTGGMDYQTMILGILSLLGGGNDNQNSPLQSFSGTGISDPVQSLQTALSAVGRLGQGLTEQSPVQLRSSYVQAPPAPISIPGLPFQIGGGLGRDPALDNPALLQAQDRGNPFKYDPFQSIAAMGSNGNPQGAGQPANPSIPGARRRTP